MQPAPVNSFRNDSVQTDGNDGSACLHAVVVRFSSGWRNEQAHEKKILYVGRSLGRVTNCHHRGGRSPSLRAGGRASDFGPTAGVSASSWATWKSKEGNGDLKFPVQQKHSGATYWSLSSTGTLTFSSSSMFSASGSAWIALHDLQFKIIPIYLIQALDHPV